MKIYQDMIDDDMRNESDVMGLVGKGSVQKGVDGSNGGMLGGLGIQYHGNMVAEPATVRGDSNGDKDKDKDKRCDERRCNE